MTNIGSIARLWRYPVKSMLGEECSTLHLDTRGVGGDRLFALRTANGKFGSGKNTRRFCQIKGLFGFRARYSEASPTVVFPDGRQFEGNDPQIHKALSDALGITVTLAREAQTSHLDAGAVHLVTTASLGWLRSRLPNSTIDERRFRPNIVIAVAGSAQPEQSWHGRILHIGSSVKLKVTASTERCCMTTFAQADLPADPTVLRCIAQKSHLQFGVYAEVLEPGPIANDDHVSLQ